MDGNRTLNVDYEVINQCTSAIRQSVQDYHIQIDIGRLQTIISQSEGEYSTQLKLAAIEVRDAYQTIVNLMYESIAMLELAKRMFVDADNSMNEIVGG